jgi:hypothetical protein
MRTGKPERTKELSQQMQKKVAWFITGSLIWSSAQCMCEYWKGAGILIFRSCRMVSIWVINNIIHMHAKCASMEDTCRMFNTMPKCDVLT